MSGARRRRRRGSPGLVVVTHGGLAEQLVAAACTIVGERESIVAVSLEWSEDVDDARERLATACARVEDGAGVVVLTDVFGGTATNLALALPADGLEIVTGVNLPMVIRFANLPDDTPLDEAARRVAEQGRESIQSVSSLLASSDHAPHRDDP